MMRQRMLEVARAKADETLQKTLSAAKQEADDKAAAIVAEAKAEADSRKSREHAAAGEQAAAIEARIVESARERAARDYDAAIAQAEEAARAERDRMLAEARRAAEEERQEQLATLAPSKPDAPERKASSPSDAELGLGKDVPPELRARIDAAMAEARKKGQGRMGEMRAALAAIKDFREGKAAVSPPDSGGTQSAAPPLDLSAATPELKEIIEIAMKRARAEGKAYPAQVQAALDAVKLYRERETKEEKAPEADNGQTSALLLGHSADPELRRVINAAMAQARAKGENYAGQVRAALDAIKAHRARTAGAGAR